MKKLNNKGFTLVELLAVIIILAIVVGITIPSVLTTTSKAKTNAFQSAANSVATWFDSQYQVALTGISTSGLATLDENFSKFCHSTGKYCANKNAITKEMAQALTGVTGYTDSIASSSSTDFKKISTIVTDYAASKDALTDEQKTAIADAERLIAAAGLTTANVEAIYVRIDSTTGRSCVVLQAKKGGDYYGVGNNSYSKAKSDGTGYSSNTNRMQSTYCPATK